MLNLSRNLGLITGASVMGAVFSLAAGTSDITTAPPDSVATAMRITFVVAATLILAALAIATVSRTLARHKRVVAVPLALSATTVLAAGADVDDGRAHHEPDRDRGREVRPVQERADDAERQADEGRGEQEAAGVDGGHAVGGPISSMGAPYGPRPVRTAAPSVAAYRSAASSSNPAASAIVSPAANESPEP